MAQQAQSSLTPELASLLKTDNRGWKTSIFDDQIMIKPSLCENCNSVCCDAVELGCDHNDADICLYCNQCLKDLINDNNNKCPINSHSDPIIISSRSTRRQISKLMVICPYSTQYTQKNKQNNKNNNNNNNDNDNGHIIDTIGGDEKEGIAPPNDNYNNNNNDKNDAIKNKHGCHWKGTFNDLITKHFGECIKKNDPSFTQIMTIKKLEKEKKSLNDALYDKNRTIAELEQKMETYERKEQENRREIDKLKQQNDEQTALIKDLTDTVDANNKEIRSLRQQLLVLDTEKKMNEEQQKQNNMNSKIRFDVVPGKMNDIVQQNGTIIKRKSSKPCTVGCSLGVNAGIHEFKIKCIIPGYDGIGITSNVNEFKKMSWVSSTKGYKYWWYENCGVFGQKDGGTIHQDNFEKRWQKGDVVAIKIDCNSWKVGFYINNVLAIKEISIIPNLTYYLFVSTQSNGTQYQLLI